MLSPSFYRRLALLLASTLFVLGIRARPSASFVPSSATMRPISTGSTVTTALHATSARNPFLSVKSMLQTARSELTKRCQKAKRIRLARNLTQTIQELESLRNESNSCSLEFEAQIKAEQAQIVSLHNFSNYHQRQFEVVCKEKEEYTENLKDYISTLESEHKSFSTMGGAALQLVKTRITKLFYP
jgi:hypothetical protein